MNKKYIVFLFIFLFLVSIYLIVLTSNTKNVNYYILGQKQYYSNFELSEKYFETAIKLNQSAQKPYLMLFHYNLIIKRDFVSAKKIVDAFIIRFPSNELGQTFQSLILLENNNKKFTQFNEILLDSNKTYYDITYLVAGIEAYHKSNYEIGDSMFLLSLTTSKFITIEENFIYFSIEKIDRILKTLIIYKKYNEALEIIKQIENKNETYNIYPLDNGYHLTINQYLAKIYLEKGDLNGSEQILLDLENKYENQTDEFGIECPYQALGLLYYKTQDLNKSVYYYKKYAELTPLRLSSQIEAGEACLLIEDLICAKHFAQKGIKINKEDPLIKKLLKNIAELDD